VFPNLLLAFELGMTEMFLFLDLMSLIFMACASWTRMKESTSNIWDPRTVWLVVIW